MMEYPFAYNCTIWAMFWCQVHGPVIFNFVIMYSFPIPAKFHSADSRAVDPANFLLMSCLQIRPPEWNPGAQEWIPRIDSVDIVLNEYRERLRNLDSRYLNHRQYVSGHLRKRFENRMSFPQLTAISRKKKIYSLLFWLSICVAKVVC